MSGGRGALPVPVQAQGACQGGAGIGHRGARACALPWAEGQSGQRGIPCVSHSHWESFAFAGSSRRRWGCPETDMKTVDRHLIFVDWERDWAARTDHFIQSLAVPRAVGTAANPGFREAKCEAPRAGELGSRADRLPTLLLTPDT